MILLIQGIINYYYDILINFLASSSGVIIVQEKVFEFSNNDKNFNFINNEYKNLFTVPFFICDK